MSDKSKNLIYEAEASWRCKHGLNEYVGGEVEASSPSQNMIIDLIGGMGELGTWYG